MRIVHFSDIHLCHLTPTPLMLFDKRLIGLINFGFRRHPVMNPNLLYRAVGLIKSLSPDVIVCTGDLTSVGAPEEFADALDALSPLLHQENIDFIFVPGNHDAYVPRQSCRESLHNAFYQLNNGRWRLDELPAYIQRGNLTFIIVNQCRPTNIVSSAGVMDKAQQNQLNEMLNSPRKHNEKRLMVAHYPVTNDQGKRLHWPRRLKNDHYVKRILEQRNVDILLSGHVHTPFKHVHSNSVIEISPGALTVHGTLNILDYSPYHGTFTQYWKNLKEPEQPPASFEALPLQDAQATE